MKRRIYRAPETERIIVVCENIIAASAPAARGLHTNSTDEENVSSGSWGNLWENWNREKPGFQSMPQKTTSTGRRPVDVVNICVKEVIPYAILHSLQSPSQQVRDEELCLNTVARRLHPYTSRKRGIQQYPPGRCRGEHLCKPGLLQQVHRDIRC